jgi:hypothetical protein
LVSNFFENKILQNPFRETRAGQGFQRHQKNFLMRDPAVLPGASDSGGLANKFIFGA